MAKRSEERQRTHKQGLGFLSVQGKHLSRKTLCAFVLGALFQCPRNAEALVGVVLCYVQLDLCVYVCDSEQLMQLSL